MLSARSVVSNVFAGVTVNVTRIVIQLVMLPLMGRLLGPDQIGLYAVAMPMFTFVLVLADAGLGQSLAREKSDDTMVWSSAFWGLLASGTILATIVYLASFPIARIAGQPDLPAIMLPLSLTIITIALTVIPGALMFRSGRLVIGAAGEFLANVISAGLAIYMAFDGFGVWALVAQTLATFIIRTIVLNLFFPYIPKLEFSSDSLLSHWNVSGAIVASRLLELGTRISENTLVSRLTGTSGVGAYGYANQIGRFFSDAVGNPVWANLYLIAIKAEPHEIARHYVGFHRRLSILLFPSATLAALALPTIIPLAMGPKWSQAILPIMILLVSYPFLTLAGLYGAILLARNESKLLLVGLSGYCVSRLIVVALTYPFGLLGMSIGISVCNISYYVWAIMFVSTTIGNHAIDIVSPVSRCLIATMLAGVTGYFWIGNSPSLARLAFVECAAGILYFLLLFVIDNRSFREDARGAWRLVQRKKPA